MIDSVKADQAESSQPSTLPKHQVAPEGQLRSRVTMIALFMAFFGPVFLAMILYYNLDLWKPEGRNNHGELMLPIKPLAFFDVIENASGETISLDVIKEQWTLIYISQKGCDLACEASLFKVRQMRLLLGRELHRVQYLFLALDDAAAKAADALAVDHPRMQRVTVLDRTKEEIAVFGDDPDGNLYLVDPLGNLVMRYGKDADTVGIKKDLMRLLRVSKIG